MDSVSPSKNGFPPFSGFTLGLGYGNFQTKWLMPVRNSEPSEWYLEFFDKKFKGIYLDISLVRRRDWAQRRNGASFHLLLSHHRESHTSTITSALPFSNLRTSRKLSRTHSANHVALAVRNHFYQNAWLVDCLLERFCISPEYSRIQAAAHCAMRFVISSKCCVWFLISMFVFYTLYI